MMEATPEQAAPPSTATTVQGSRDNLPESRGDFSQASTENLQKEEPEEKFEKGARFYIVLFALCLTYFSTGLEAIVITTSLPYITKTFVGEQDYVWIANAFVLASTVVQPLCAQLSDIFGRRIPMIVALSLFALGGGISGGANSLPMLIAGRTVQGIGAGCLFVLVDLVTCDITPLRERSKYLGIVMSLGAVGTTIGPVVGGALAQASWRWVFYINIPTSGLALAVVTFFLRVKYNKQPDWKTALSQIDYFGNALFIASICAILLALVMGGTSYPWGSYHILVPLILGFAGWAAFHVYQASSYCKMPTMPTRLFKNRTSSVGFVLAFLAAVLLQWSAYFLPLYFQSLKNETPLQSGVDVLPLNAVYVPVAIIAGGVMAKTGQYKPLHWGGFSISAIAFGILTLLGPDSPTVMWVFFQLICAAGLGLLMATILPVIQAALPEADVAKSTGAFTFIRSFGFVWGVTIPSITFNGQINAYLNMITDPSVQAKMANGGAFGYAGTGEIAALSPSTQSEVHAVYQKGMQALWYCGMAFALVGFLVVFAEKHTVMRAGHNSEFGLEDGKKNEAKVVEDGKAEK